MKDKRVNVIGKVAKENVLITNNSLLSKALSVNLSDETGCIKMILLDKQTEKVHNNFTGIFRNVLIRVIDSFIFLVCDQDSVVFPLDNQLLSEIGKETQKNTLCRVNDYSAIKLSIINKNLI